MDGWMDGRMLDGSYIDTSQHRTGLTRTRTRTRTRPLTRRPLPRHRPYGGARRAQPRHTVPSLRAAQRSARPTLGTVHDPSSSIGRLGARRLKTTNNPLDEPRVRSGRGQDEVRMSGLNMWEKAPTTVCGTAHHTLEGDSEQRRESFLVVRSL